MANELEKRGKKEVEHSGAEQLRSSGPAFVPDVDVFSSADDLLFVVDLPGVAKGDVTIDIDQSDTMVVRARNHAKEPDNPVVQQFRVGDYYRAFQLSDDYNKEKVSAKLDNGVLVVRIPMREEAKPRSVQVSA